MKLIEDKTRLRELRETPGNAETPQELTGRAGDAVREPRMLPQWALDLIRKIIHVLSRLLWNVRFVGEANIPPHEQGGLIIAANHQTYVDPFWISLLVKRPTRYLAWNEAFAWPVVGRLLEIFGAWPLQLENSGPSAIRRSLQWLRGGGAIVIFPEGGRAEPKGVMARFKPGAARMALEARVPIMPVTIRGGNRIWPRGWMLPRLAQLEIVYHPLYYVTPKPGEPTRDTARRATNDLADTIGKAL